MHSDVRDQVRQVWPALEQAEAATSRRTVPSNHEGDDR